MRPDGELLEKLTSHRLWLSRDAGECANLEGAQLADVNLEFQNLSHAKLSRANLVRGRMESTRFKRAELVEADLSYSDLSYADLRWADLRRANLRFARLTGAMLVEANLQDADLRGAEMSNCELSGARLGGSMLLEVEAKPDLVSRIYRVVKDQPERLDMTTWHTCDTTHCLAGWAVSLHPQGESLVSKLTIDPAAAIIFNACCGEVPNFYSSKRAAMQWLERVAARSGE